eukprot:COSAG05_NODE_7054_length_862_cov_0.585845_1_plen_77_part_10
MTRRRSRYFSHACHKDLSKFLCISNDFDDDEDGIAVWGSGRISPFSAVRRRQEVCAEAGVSQARVRRRVGDWKSALE